MSKRSEQEQHVIETSAGALAGAVAVGLCHRSPDTATEALGRFGKSKQIQLPYSYTAFGVFNGSSYVTEESLLEVARLALDSLRSFYQITGIQITVTNETEPAFLVEKAEK